MNKSELIALAQSLGLSATEDMTIDQLKALLANYKPVATQQSALATTTADAVFRPMDTSKMSTFTGVKIVFLAPSKNGVRLIVRKSGSDSTFAVYVFTEAVNLADAHVGDSITILAEQKTSKKDGKLYWNATAISKL